jgi:hypothetical protein
MKNSYILLRNNKESASLYLEDLQKIGLKPTDLIWIECQSVGWRKPQEISELKALVSENHNQDIKISSLGSVEDIPEPFEIMPLKNIEKKPVFVEMLPKQETTIKESLKPLTDSLSDNMKKYGDPDNTVRSVFDSKEVDLKTNYSRPLDEIKEMYVKRLGKKEQLKKSIIKIQLPPQVKKLALYTGLVVTGALMMLLIKNTESKSIASVMPDYKKPDTVIITAAAQPTALDENIVSTTESYEKQNFPPEEQKQPVDLNKNMPLKKPVEKNETTDINNEKAEKNTKPANEIKVLKTVTLENISSKLALKANDYNVGSFGGIRNLEMTLQNNSKYLLDRVTVEISYLNPEGIILKTDNIYFQSIQPGDAAVIPVNKTKRGVKVNYKITKIESKELVSDNSKTVEQNNYTSN